MNKTPLKIILYGFFIMIFNLYFFRLLDPILFKFHNAQINIFFDYVYSNIFNLFTFNSYLL